MSADRSSENVVARVQAILDSIVGLHAWNVRRGVGSFVQMEFGTPRVELGAPTPSRLKLLGRKGRVVRPAVIRGDFQLWLYQCDWRFQVEGAEVMSQTATDVEMRELGRILNGQVLQQVVVEPDLSSTFSFDLNTIISTSPANAEDQWMVFDERTRTVATWRGDGFVSLRAQDAAGDGEGDWHQLTAAIASHIQPRVL